jgi:GNAT superfamily N-acetyltransferase
VRITRRAEQGDLPALLDLYLHLNADMPRLPDHQSQEIWTRTLSSDDVAVFVSVVDQNLVATCLLITAPNLMRGGAPHALLENVVTHRDFRRQGHGRATIGAALLEAWKRGCYHVFLVTGRGRAKSHVLSFYGRCGFQPGGKTGLVAVRPGGQG